MQSVNLQLVVNLKNVDGPWPHYTALSPRANEVIEQIGSVLQCTSPEVAHRGPWPYWS